MSDGKVVDMPGVRGAQVVGIALTDLTLAATHLAIQKAIDIASKSTPAIDDAARTRDLSYRLGYVRGLLEWSHELLAQAVQQAAPSAVPAAPSPGGNARA